MTIRTFGAAGVSALAFLAAATLSGGVPVASAGPVALASDTHVVTAPAPKPTPHARNVTCSKALTKGTIGGVSKCLGAGQQCQHAHAADYTKYGFTCSSVNGGYRLVKKGGSLRSNLKPLAKPGVKKTP